MRPFLLVIAGVAPAGAFAQVPDLINALDAGGRAMGMGGAGYATGSDTLAGYYNPAGLGYVTRGTLDLTFRNMPESRTVVSGDIGPGGTARFDTQGERGPTGLGHAGIAFPLKGRNGGSNGTIALTLTKGGALRDQRVGSASLVEGTLNAANYSELLKISTDFLNLSYGRSTQDGTFNWGLGVVYALNRQTNHRLAPSGTTLFDEEANGLGFQAGIQFTPKDSSNVSLGFSLRTPITLRGGNNALIYKRIPGRVMGGIAFRQDGFRSNRDYIVFGADVQHFFNGEGSGIINRESQTVFGIGAEYNFTSSFGRVPIRLGYTAVQGGGGGLFGDRNAFTFGFGFRPTNSDFGLDVNWARPNRGGNDLSLSLSYKFGK